MMNLPIEAWEREAIAPKPPEIIHPANIINERVTDVLLSLDETYGQIITDVEELIRSYPEVGSDNEPLGWYRDEDASNDWQQRWQYSQQIPVIADDKQPSPLVALRLGISARDKAKSWEAPKAVPEGLYWQVVRTTALDERSEVIVSREIRKPSQIYIGYMRKQLIPVGNKSYVARYFDHQNPSPLTSDERMGGWAANTEFERVLLPNIRIAVSQSEAVVRLAKKGTSLLFSIDEVKEREDVAAAAANIAASPISSPVRRHKLRSRQRQP